MAEAKFIVQRRDGTPIPPDEPCFVIRAQDALAVAAVTAYLNLAVQVGSPQGFLADIEWHRRLIAEWQAAHGRKLPD